MSKVRKNTGAAPVTNVDGEGRGKALDLALSQIEKQFGTGAVMKMGAKASLAIETVPTGALALDLALGIGGLPRGRVVEIFGPEGSGKTTLSPPTSWPRRSAMAVSAPTSTPSTPWTPSTPGPSASTSTNS